MFSGSKVVEEGLLLGVLVVIMNASITLETLEVLTGVIGALAIYAMKSGASKRRACTAAPLAGTMTKCQDVRDGSLQGCEPAPCPYEVEQSRQTTNELSPRSSEFAQLPACVQAELEVHRATCRLEGWERMAKHAEAELVQLRERLIELEHDLSHAHFLAEETLHTRIDDLLTDVTETQLRTEEVEAELVWAQTNMADVEIEVTNLISIQNRMEALAMPGMESLSTDVTPVNDQSVPDLVSSIWMLGI